MAERTRETSRETAVAQTALKQVAERHPECQTPEEVLVVYPEIVGRQALGDCALPSALRARGWRTLRQAFNQREREWHVHPVPMAEMARAYQEVIQAVCAQLLASAGAPE